MSQGKRPVRRRGGLIPRLVFAVATTLLVMELGLRLVLGNGAQGFVVQPSPSREVCFELAPDERVLYTGDAVRAARTWITTNGLGARGDAAEGEAEGIRIAILGDAFVFGPGVEDDQTLTAAAEQELRRRGYANELINLGVPGTSPPQAVARLERTLSKVQPDAAVLIVSPDDLDPGASDCPHDGVVHDVGVLSAGAAQRQLQVLLSTRVYIVRAVRLVRDAGLDGLLHQRGPYGPGRERRGDDAGDEVAVLPPGPMFASSLEPKELYGDVPILMPQKRQVPAIVPQGLEEYSFVAAVERLQAVGAEHGFPVAVALLPDRQSFERISQCDDCRTPQRLLSQHDGLEVVNLASLWTQMLREPHVWFQPGEGWLSAAGNEEVGKALASELAFWEALRLEVR